MPYHADVLYEEQKGGGRTYIKERRLLRFCL